MALVIATASSFCLAALTVWAVVAARRAPRASAQSPPVKLVRAMSGANLLEGLGARLRAAREAHAVTVAQVAAATKIKEGLITGLERGDLEGWPQGLFRRAFVREYARAIGLDPDRVFAEFSWIQTDPAASTVMVERRARPRFDTPRLTLGDQRSIWAHDAGLRLLHALADLSLVALAASALSWGSGVDVVVVAALAAIVCYPLSLVVFGETAAGRAHRWLTARVERSQSEIGLRLVPPPERTTPGHAERRALGNSERDTDQPQAASG